MDPWDRDKGAGFQVVEELKLRREALQVRGGTGVRGRCLRGRPHPYDKKPDEGHQEATQPSLHSALLSRFIEKGSRKPGSVSEEAARAALGPRSSQRSSGSWT